MLLPRDMSYARWDSSVGNNATRRKTFQNEKKRRRKKVPNLILGEWRANGCLARKHPCCRHLCLQRAPAYTPCPPQRDAPQRGDGRHSYLCPAPKTTCCLSAPCSSLIFLLHSSPKNSACSARHTLHWQGSAQELAGLYNLRSSCILKQRQPWLSQDPCR